MLQDTHKIIKALLASTKPEELRKGMDLVRQEISRVGSREAKELFEMVSAIFYIDPLDHPDLVPILDEAVSLTVGFGEWIIPVLLENLDAGDIKAQLVVGHTLGRFGVDAIKQLISQYQQSTDPERRTFILYALGKIKSPKIVQAAHLALEAAESQNRELRDTATRAIGKFIESIPPADLPQELRIAFTEKLQKNLSDPNAGIRAKAIRSYGKLARYGHLNNEERKNLQTICQGIIGIDGNYNWDRAYIVRKEAEEAITYT